MSIEVARAWVFEASASAPAASGRLFVREPIEIMSRGRPLSPAEAMAAPDGSGPTAAR